MEKQKIEIILNFIRDDKELWDDYTIAIQSVLEKALSRYNEEINEEISPLSSNDITKFYISPEVELDSEAKQYQDYLQNEVQKWFKDNGKTTELD
jgi:tRNA isopentenyl-2-thiomethyl-A-37 hydroxylase MiaE